MNKEIVESLYAETLYNIEHPLLVVLDKPWNELKATEVELLSKILLSIKRSLASVKIIHQPIFNHEEYESPKVILFGAKANPKIESYTLISLNNSLLIQADALDKLDDAMKKSLWQSLRQLNG